MTYTSKGAKMGLKDGIFKYYSSLSGYSILLVEFLHIWTLITIHLDFSLFPIWAQVPASVRVRRETAAPKAKPKPSVSVTATATQPAAPTIVMPESANSSSAPKPQSIDDSYMAFLEDMKALGALDSWDHCCWWRRCRE